MLREESLQFANDRHGKQKQSSACANKNIVSGSSSYCISNNTAVKESDASYLKKVNRLSVLSPSSSSSSAVLRLSSPSSISVVKADKLEYHSFRYFLDLLNHQNGLPPFLSVSRLASLSHIRHLYSLWIRAALQPDLRPIFWIWLSQSQRLLIRSRLHRRMQRLDRHFFNPLFKSLPAARRQCHRQLRQHQRRQWYGIYPLPPTSRAHLTWKRTQQMIKPWRLCYQTKRSKSISPLTTPTATESAPTLLSSSATSSATLKATMVSSCSKTTTDKTALLPSPPIEFSLTPRALLSQGSSISSLASKNHCRHQGGRSSHVQSIQRQTLSDHAPSPSPRHSSRKQWMPPINSESLHELSISKLFRSIQLRHDLLFDAGLSFRPNLDGASGHEKCKKAQRYWRRVDRIFSMLLHHDEDKEAKFDCLRVLLEELRKILISLYAPFASSPASHEPWHWPPHISLDDLDMALDSDYIIHQIEHGSFCLDPLAKLLIAILTPLCPADEKRLLDLLMFYLEEENLSKAIRQCYYILETIKLDCANKILRSYRPYLLDTCPQVEYQCFKKQIERNEIKLDSTYKWLRHNWQLLGRKSCFLDVYYQSLIRLVSGDTSISDENNSQPSPTFPITLQFDERRLTQQFRHEFQSLILMSILLIPYRYLAGPFATPSDMARLKRACVELCRECSLTRTTTATTSTSNLLSFFGGRVTDPVSSTTKLAEDKAVLRVCYRLAYKACHRAFQAHYRHHQQSSHHHLHLPLTSTTESTTLDISFLGPEQLCRVSQFWANWLVMHLNAESEIYAIVYRRLCDLLSFISQHGAYALEETNMATMMKRMVGVQENIVVLGEKIKALADLNLGTFGPVYRLLSIEIRQQM